MIDTHAHANFRKLQVQFEDVIERSRDANVFTIVNIGIDVETSYESIALSEKYQDIICAVGIHPNTVVEDFELALKEIQYLTKHPCVVAIGEIGLDFYRDYVSKSVQIEMLKAQLELANNLRMPVALHIRPSKENFDDVFEVFKEIFSDYSHLEGVLHAFAGREDFVKWVNENTRLYYGLGGPITFKNYGNLDAIRQMPLDRIVTETDCPYLAPHPFRGKTNEPALIPYIVERLSKFFRKPEDEIDRITSYNASKLFNIGLPGSGQSQVFLKSENYLDDIASIFDKTETGPIALEIGAGAAVLTKRLSQRYEKVYAIEPDLAVYPKDFMDAVVIPKSVLDVNIKNLSEFVDNKLTIYGNIPYHLTSDIIFYLLENIEYIDQIALLIQKEVAERLTSKPNSKEFGIPTLILGNSFEISYKFDVPAEAFKPKPDVTSAVITLTPRPKPICSPKDPELFQEIIKKAFGQRRKMLRKSLKGIIKNIPSRYEKMRPEQLRIEDFGNIADANS